jgi:Actinobacteria/chloroflexi VLRF1 release factor
MKNPAAGGGRWVAVAPGRFATWVDEFARRHGGITATVPDDSGAIVTFTAADGAVAECHPPFPPLHEPGEAPDPAAMARAIAAHAAAGRTVAVLLVRLGGYAVGVFTGAPPVLASSRTGSRPVHGRSAAGGWSQHRFARRREKQASEALAAAADAAAAQFGQQREIDAVVLGGDRRAVAGLADDPRLTPHLAKATDRFLTVPDPRLAVLRDTPRAFQAIRIRLTGPPPPAGPPPSRPRRPPPSAGHPA